MTARATDRLSACQKDGPGPGGPTGTPEKAVRTGRQKRAGSTKPPFAYFSLLFFLMVCTFLDWVPVYGSTLQLRMQDNLLSLDAVDADLSAVLQRLGETAGIDFKFSKALDKKVTLQLSDVRLESALKRILKGLNYATVYSVAGNGGSNSISAVYIYGRQKGGSTRTGQPVVDDKRAQHRISDYEKRIRVVQQRLEKVERDSPVGRRYQKEIENYQRLIDRLKLRK